MNAAHEIEQQLRALVAARLALPQAHIDETAAFDHDLGADSLDMVSLIMDVEDEFDIDIPDEDAVQLHTFKQLLEYVELTVAADDALLRSSNVRH